MGELDGRSAIVTGAGRGFGRAIATALAAAGAHVTLIALEADELTGVVDEIQASGGTARPAAADVRDRAAVHQAHVEHVAAFGPASIAVSCAGRTDPVGPIGEVDLDAWWRTMEVNVRAPLYLMDCVLPDMRSADTGTIINVSSIAALAIIPFNTAYSVTKATLHRLTEHVAVENTQSGVAAFAIHPGIAFTRLMADALDDDMRRWMPQMVGHFEQLRDHGDVDAAMQQCGRNCVALATGRHDDLSGRLLDMSRPEIAEAELLTPPGQA